MSRALYAGSFDPITRGHLNIIERASKLFDKLFVGVAVNPDKKHLFNIRERHQMTTDAIRDIGIENIDVVEIPGLLVDYCNQYDIQYFVRGLRVSTDFEYEMQMFKINRDLGNVETIFLPADPNQTHLSSSAVRQLAKFGHCLDTYVTKNVYSALQNKYSNSDSKSVIA